MFSPILQLFQRSDSDTRSNTDPLRPPNTTSSVPLYFSSVAERLHHPSASSTRSLRDPVVECAICLNTLSADNSVALTCDGAHRYHKSCITGWFEIRQSCPTCQASEIEIAPEPEAALRFESISSGEFRQPVTPLTQSTLNSLEDYDRVNEPENNFLLLALTTSTRIEDQASALSTISCQRNRVLDDTHTYIDLMALTQTDNITSRKNLATALAYFNSEVVNFALLTLATDFDEDVHQEAMVSITQQSLRILPDTPAIQEQIVNLVRFGEVPTRLKLAQALAYFYGEAVSLALQFLEQDDRSEVRLQARESMDTLASQLLI